jgi:hypothetical protein
MGVQRDVESAFQFKVKPVLEKVAKDKGLQLVFNLDDGLLAWADPSLDITADVIKRLTPTVPPTNRQFSGDARGDLGRFGLGRLRSAHLASRNATRLLSLVGLHARLK